MHRWSLAHTSELHKQKNAQRRISYKASNLILPAVVGWVERETNGKQKTFLCEWQSHWSWSNHMPATYYSDNLFLVSPSFPLMHHLFISLSCLQLVSRRLSRLLSSWLKLSIMGILKPTRKLSHFPKRFVHMFISSQGCILLLQYHWLAGDCFNFIHL